MIVCEKTVLNTRTVFLLAKNPIQFILVNLLGKEDKYQGTVADP